MCSDRTGNDFSGGARHAPARSEAAPSPAQVPLTRVLNGRDVEIPADLAADLLASEAAVAQLRDAIRRGEAVDSECVARAEKGFEVLARSSGSRPAG